MSNVQDLHILSPTNKLGIVYHNTLTKVVSSDYDCLGVFLSICVGLEWSMENLTYLLNQFPSS